MEHARGALGVTTVTTTTGDQVILAVGGTGDGQNTLRSTEKWSVDNTVDFVGCSDAGKTTCPPNNTQQACIGGPPTYRPP